MLVEGSLRHSLVPLPAKDERPSIWHSAQLAAGFLLHGLALTANCAFPSALEHDVVKTKAIRMQNENVGSSISTAMTDSFYDGPPTHVRNLSEHLDSTAAASGFSHCQGFVGDSATCSIWNSDALEISILGQLQLQLASRHSREA